MKPSRAGFTTGVVGTLASLEGFGVAGDVGVVAGVVWANATDTLSKARAQTVV
jgi:hypothetical protein